MRVSRRWLALTLLLPGAGLAVLLHAGTSSETTVREKSPYAARERANSGAPRMTSRGTAEPDGGRAEPAASKQPTDKAGSAPARAAASPLAASLRPLIARLHKASDEDDKRAIAARRAEISSIIAKDPAAALQALLAEFRVADEEGEAGVILALLTGETALPHDQLLAALNDMASHDELTFHRQAAIHTLGEVAGGDADRVAQVADLGRHDRESEVRETAAVTLGALGDRSPGAVAQAAANELLQSLAPEANGRVRSCLIYAFRDTRDPAVAAALTGALADGDATVRLAAADMLGDVAAAHRDKTVQALADRFAQESDREVRQTIVTAMVRAGKIGAIPALEKLQGGEVQPLIDDFLAGLRSGEDNLEKLYALRFARQNARKAN